MHISSHVGNLPYYLRTQFVKLAWDLFTFSFLASFLLLSEKRWCRKSNFRGLNPFNQISFPSKIRSNSISISIHPSGKKKVLVHGWMVWFSEERGWKIISLFEILQVASLILHYDLKDVVRCTQPTIFFFQLESNNWISCSCFNRKSIGFFTYFQLNKINYVSDMRCKVHRCWARAKKIAMIWFYCHFNFFTYHTQSSSSFQN